MLEHFAARGDEVLVIAPSGAGGAEPNRG
ncbi:hypothetical protein, partial [Arthrobacter sp. CAL618]